MNKILVCLCSTFLLVNQLAFGQAQPIKPLLPESASSQATKPVLTKFDLDFPGGYPLELVKAIEKASGKPLNAIVPDGFQNLRLLPELKMNGVDVAQLFAALQAASLKNVTYVTGTYATGGLGGRERPITQSMISTYGFKTQGTPTDDSIWYFYYETPSVVPEPIICRFWQLESYLTKHKIEDITTAIQTGWKMLGESSPPTMNFHADTKLLIAVGQEEKLKLIDSVLRELTLWAKATPPPPSAPTQTQPPQKPQAAN